MPVLNEAASIEEAIVRARRLNTAEILVVDGGSTDGTPEIVRRLGCTCLESPRGRAKQQNLGARAAIGDVLLFLHADCWLEPQASEQIANTMCSPGIPGGAFQQRIEAPGLIYRCFEVGNAMRVICLRVPFGDQAIFLRRSVFEQLGGFPDVRLMEDVLLMQAVRNCGRIALLPGPLHVSARRWQKHGPLRQWLRNWVLLTAQSCGVHPDRLAQFYAPHSAPPQPGGKNAP